MRIQTGKSLHKPQRWQRLFILLVGLLLVILLASLQGCGLAIQKAFSGGGVPIGGTRLFGTVISATEPSRRLANIRITVNAQPFGSVTPQSVTITTGNDGTFALSQVLPGFTGGTVQVTATTSDLNFRTQQIVFQTSGGRSLNMILSLAPVTVDVGQARSLELSLPAATLPPGKTFQITARLRDAIGNDLNYMPTLLLDGSFATLTNTGELVIADKVAGTGTISAYWYDLAPQSSNLRIDPSAPEPPPTPPVLPTRETNRSTTQPKVSGEASTFEAEGIDFRRNSK